MIKKVYRTRIEQFKRFIKFRILHTNDSPHRIAKGMAVGLFIAWSPLIGLHIILALLLSTLLKANKFIAVIGVWVCNPFTIVPIYYPSYFLGKKILSIFYPENNFSGSQIKDMFSSFESGNIIAFLHTKFWKDLFVFLYHAGIELWLGSILMGITVAVIGYMATFYIVNWYRKTHPHKRFT